MIGQDLIYAILGGNTEEVRRLLAMGADPNEVTTSPWERMTPLAALAASPTAGPEILSFLIAAGMRLFRDEHLQGEWARLAPREMLERIRLAEIGPEGIGTMLTGFFNAVFRNEIDKVRRYLDLGLDPNLVDPDGQPVLHSAESPEMIRLLVEAGADIEGADALGNACAVGKFEAVQTLVELGANPDATYGDGYSMLMVAARGLEPDPRVIRLLLAYGANARRACNDGYNSLHEWAEAFDSGDRDQDREEIVRILIEAGTSLEARTVSGHTPLHIALLVDRIGDALCLLQHGSDPNARVLPRQPDQDLDSATPLMLAVGQPEVLTALLHAGADPHLIDLHGRTALDYAREKLTHQTKPSSDRRVFAASNDGQSREGEDRELLDEAYAARREVKAYDDIVHSIALVERALGP